MSPFAFYRIILPEKLKKKYYFLKTKNTETPEKNASFNIIYFLCD